MRSRAALCSILMGSRSPLVVSMRTTTSCGRPGGGAPLNDALNVQFSHMFAGIVVVMVVGVTLGNIFKSSVLSGSRSCDIVEEMKAR
jgi:hypothetical protein